MFRSQRRIATVFAALSVMALVLVSQSSAAFAARAQGGSDTSSGKTESLATLKVTNPGVDLKKKGADVFKPAKDGADLREGDTVRTDAQGLAEIDYSEDSYTRLDVNTTFTIVKLTDEQGARQVQGSLETGKTWNRTAALTESGSFEQQGAGANATVLGTVFTVWCDRVDHCVFIAIEHVTRTEGADGVIKLLAPRDSCDSESGILCIDPRTLSVDELASNAFIQAMLEQDLLERGLGDGPFVRTRRVVVKEQAVEVGDALYPPPVEGPATDVGGISVSAPNSVAGSAQDSGSLPFTGSDTSAPLAWVGFGLALVGGFVVLVSYRRRSSGSLDS